MTTKPHPAAEGSPWRAVAVAAVVSLGAVGVLSAPRMGVAPVIAIAIAGLAAALAVLALPSFSTRRTSVLVLGVGALGVLRHAALPTSDGTLIMFWAAATLIAFVLVDRADAEATPSLAGSPPLTGRLPEATRAAVAVGAIVVLLAVSVVPALTVALQREKWLGNIPTFDDAANAPTSLRSARQIDMTSRPRLTDRVVFTVDAPRADFWRGEVFDKWDGTQWTRSDDRLEPVPRSGDVSRLFLDPVDPGAQGGKETSQTFHIESAFTDIVFAAPSGAEVRTDRLVVGRADGTAGVVGGLGKGSVYSVMSRNLLPTAADLRAADDREIPGDVLDRYAETPVATQRVRQLARTITAGSPTTYDKIRAIEAWLGANTQYSLDAPLSPRGVDVVDHFLFESRLGWCEQVASSLVVLARSAGIPARLATGFVPGERDELSGRFVVRENMAHAWTEVYFPGIGWQGFDPTASVPLSGEAPSGGSWFDRARNNLPELVVGLGAVVLVVGSAPDVVAWCRRVLRRRRSWPARTLAHLERLGRRRGRPRHPSEGPLEYARALARDLDDERLVDVGATIDRDAFVAVGATESERDHAESILASVGSDKPT